jgi:hypothetical protein
MKKDTLRVIFEFSKTGFLRAILLSGETEEEQKILESALDRIFNPPSWIKRLFRRW